MKREIILFFMPCHNYRLKCRMVEIVFFSLRATQRRIRLNKR